MISVSEKVAVKGKRINGKKRYKYLFMGLSSDVFPVGSYKGNFIADGSVFFVLDSDETKFYDESKKEWLLYKKSRSFSTSSQTENATTTHIPIYEPIDINVTKKDIISKSETKNIFNKALEKRDSGLGLNL